MMVNLSSPLVSVIIPVYNSELYLEACIESVIGQSYSTLEIIIVNDGLILLKGNIFNTWIAMMFCCPERLNIW